MGMLFPGGAAVISTRKVSACTIRVPKLRAR